MSPIWKSTNDDDTNDADTFCDCNNVAEETPLTSNPPVISVSPNKLIWDIFGTSPNFLTILPKEADTFV